ncbi:MAG: hypothetical protein ACO3NK_13610 [Prochlorotrichaceae cyanobacterium]
MLKTAHDPVTKLDCLVRCFLGMTDDRGKIANMVVRQPRYSKEEFAQRGDRWHGTQFNGCAVGRNCSRLLPILHLLVPVFQPDFTGVQSRSF